MKQSRKIKPQSATLARAMKSVTPEQAKKGGFEPMPFQEFDKDFGTMYNYRLTRKAPVKALERLIRQNGNTKPYLGPIETQAANLYHIERCQAQGGSDYTLREQVDRSSSPGATQLFLLDMQQRLSRIKCRMAPDLYSAIDEIFTHHDLGLTKIWPDAVTRKYRKKEIKDGLFWLAGEYGLISRKGK